MKKNPTNRLLKSIKTIYYHKTLQAKGFEILANKTKNKQINEILQKYHEEEKSLAEYWLKIINELDFYPQTGTTFLKDIKTNFIFRILGPIGFFVWTIEGEMQAIKSFEIEIEPNKNSPVSHQWEIIASDERRHLERIKKEFIGNEAWKKYNGGGVRDMIFGLNDGLVSTLAFVVGAYGAFMDSRIVLISGFAELLAGTISMAISSYQSSKSEVEVIEKEHQNQFSKKSKKSSQEKNDLINFYQTRGFTITEAKAIVNRLEENVAFQVVKKQRKILSQLGLTSERVRNPIKSGLLCGFSFAFAALIPLFPFILPLKSSDALLISILASVLALFGAGCLKTVFSRKKLVRSGLEMMLIGIAATGITYLIGSLFSIIH